MMTHKRTKERSAGGAALATGLGWFSIGLGLAEIAAPALLSKLIGINNDARTRTTLRAYGLREIATGIAILAAPRSPLPLWGRVLGDGLDLASLGAGLRDDDNGRARIMGSMASVAGVTILDVIAAIQTSRTRSSTREPVIRTITVNRPPHEVYAMWRDFEQFPRFMEHLEAVHDLGDGVSHWVAKLPTGNTVEWNATLVGDRPAERIAWRTVDGSQVPHRGAVNFKPTLDGGTEVRVEMQYDVPGSRSLGAFFAKLASGSQIEGDLRRFKQVLETGEVIHSDASIHKGMHPARPTNETFTGKGLLQ